MGGRRDEGAPIVVRSYEVVTVLVTLGHIHTDSEPSASVRCHGETSLTCSATSDGHWRIEDPTLRA